MRLFVDDSVMSLEKMKVEIL